MPARLGPYVAACQGDIAKARRLYVWNIEVSTAFWGPISGVEIAFRNAVHRVLVTQFGRPDWWHCRSLPERDIGTAHDAEARLRRERARITNAAAPTADDVVAALSFGFWSSIVDGPSSALEQNRHWHTCVRDAFPKWHYKLDDE